MPLSSIDIQPIKIFLAYTHKDEEQLANLRIHLLPIEQIGLIEIWYDRDISAGEEWMQDVSQHLYESQIILLLVSPRFLASDYCNSVEVENALVRHEQGQARVIPIILRECIWEITPLKRLQALPKDAKPVFKWKHRDDAFHNVADGVLKVVKELLLAESLVKCEAGYYKEALTIIERVLSIDEKNVAAKSGQEYALDNLEHYKKALVDAIGRTHPHYKNNPLAWYIKGRLLHDLKLHKEALISYDRAIQLYKDDASLNRVFRDKAVVLGHLKRYKEALNAFDEALRFSPDDVWVLTLKGITMRNLQLKEEALKAHNQAIQLEPRNTWAITQKAITLRAFKRYEEALAVHEQAIKANENEGWVHTEKAITLRDFDKCDESIAAHTRAIEVEPEGAWFHYEKAMTLQKYKKYKGAIACFDDAIRLNPNDATYYTQKAITLRDFSLSMHDEDLQDDEEIR